MARTSRLWARSSALLLVGLAAVVCAYLGRGVWAQEAADASKNPAPQGQKGQTTGQPKSGAAGDERKADKDPLLEGLSDELLKKLEQEAKGEVSEEPEDPPLIRIGDHMREVQQRLAERDTGKKTIELQARIIAEIDELLKQLRQNRNQNQNSQQNQTARRDQTGSQQQQQQQSSRQTGTQAARDGQRVMPRGPDARSRAELERMARAVWGHLPPKVREQMEQALSASFLPQYEPLIERYFRTLAERGAGGQ